jgi:hypothetical protein
MPSGDVIASIYADSRAGRASAAFKKKPAFAGSETKQKAKDAGTSASAAGNAAPGAADAGGSGDDDGGDGEGDGDGPRRPAHSNPSLPPRIYPRAHRRSNLPTPLTRRAFAWLLTLALLLAYAGPPGFALLFVRLGHPELASEMLRYKPVLLLPTPPGWTSTSQREEKTDTSPTVTVSTGVSSPDSKAQSSLGRGTCRRSTGISESTPARRSSKIQTGSPVDQLRVLASRERAATPTAHASPHNTCYSVPPLAGGMVASDLISQH